MKVEGVQNTNPIIPPEKLDHKDKAGDSKEKITETAAVYEKSQPMDKGHIYGKETIEQLKRDSEMAFGYLKRIVEDMLRRQGKNIHLMDPDEVIKVDETAKAEAQNLIAEDGPLGVEAVTHRIVSFAKAISGGDKSKLDTLRKAIDQGFKEAEKILGKLPEISQKTYDRIMEELDIWENEE